MRSIGYFLLAIATLTTACVQPASCHSVQHYRIGEAANPGPTTGSNDRCRPDANGASHEADTTTGSGSTVRWNNTSWLDDPEGPADDEAMQDDQFFQYVGGDTAFNEPPPEEETPSAAIPRGVPPAGQIPPCENQGSDGSCVNCSKYDGRRAGFYFGTVNGATGYHRDHPKIAVLSLSTLVTQADPLCIPISLAEGLGLPDPGHGNQVTPGADPHTSSERTDGAGTAERGMQTLPGGNLTSPVARTITEAAATPPACYMGGIPQLRYPTTHTSPRDAGR